MGSAKAIQIEGRCYPAEIVSRVQTHLNSFLVGDPESALAEFTLAVLDEMEQGQLTPNQADDCFTLLSICLDEEPELRHVKLSGQAEVLLDEGQLLYDLGVPYGANVQQMKDLAKHLKHLKGKKHEKGAGGRAGK